MSAKGLILQELIAVSAVLRSQEYFYSLMDGILGHPNITPTIREATWAEWFRVLDLKSGGPLYKSSTLLLSGFVLGSPEFNSSTTLCK